MLISNNSSLGFASLIPIDNGHKNVPSTNFFNSDRQQTYHLLLYKWGII